jgi:hypothetical protein
LTIIFDDIIKDPRGVLVALCRHLDVDTSWAGDVPSAELAFLQVLYRPMINPLSDLLGRDLSPWLDWDRKRGGG